MKHFMSFIMVILTMFVIGCSDSKPEATNAAVAKVKKPSMKGHNAAKAEAYEADRLAKAAARAKVCKEAEAAAAAKKAAEPKKLSLSEQAKINNAKANAEREAKYRASLKATADAEAAHKAKLAAKEAARQAAIVELAKKNELARQKRVVELKAKVKVLEAELVEANNSKDSLKIFAAKNRLDEQKTRLAKAEGKKKKLFKSGNTPAQARAERHEKLKLRLIEEEAKLPVREAKVVKAKAAEVEQAKLVETHKANWRDYAASVRTEGERKLADCKKDIVNAEHMVKIVKRDIGHIKGEIKRTAPSKGRMRLSF